MGREQTSTRNWARFPDAGPILPSPLPCSVGMIFYVNLWARLPTVGESQDGNPGLSGRGWGGPRSSTTAAAAGGRSGPSSLSPPSILLPGFPQRCISARSTKLPITLDGLMQRDTSTGGTRCLECTISFPVTHQLLVAAGARSCRDAASSQLFFHILNYCSEQHACLRQGNSPTLSQDLCPCCSA